jgi:hypothetical protein
MIGGNRSGKTTCGAVETMWWALDCHPYRDTPSPCKILAVENTWSLVGDPMWTKLSKPKGLKTCPTSIMPRRVVSSVAYESRAMEIPRRVSFKNGSTVDFRSCDSGREKFEGSLVFQEIMRGLVDRGGCLIWTATPLAQARPLLELHEMAGDPEAALDVEEVQLSIYDNPYLNERARDSFISTIPEEYRETRLHGNFLILEGLVYGEWDKHVHDISRKEFEAMSDQNPRVIVLDPGYAYPCAVLWAMLLPGIERQVVVYREFYKKRQTVSDVVKHIARVSQDEPLVAAIIDPESLKRNQSGFQCVFEQYSKAFRNAGLRNHVTGGPLKLTLVDNDVEAGIYIVKEFLNVNDEGIPGIRAVDDLRHFHKELARYRWAKEGERTRINKPVDTNNHLMDALRYLMKRLPKYALGAEAMDASTARSARIAKMVREDLAPSHSISIGG